MHLNMEPYTLEGITAAAASSQVRLCHPYCAASTLCVICVVEHNLPKQLVLLVFPIFLTISACPTRTSLRRRYPPAITNMSWWAFWCTRAPWTLGTTTRTSRSARPTTRSNRPAGTFSTMPSSTYLTKGCVCQASSMHRTRASRCCPCPYMLLYRIPLPLQTRPCCVLPGLECWLVSSCRKYRLVVYRSQILFGGCIGLECNLVF